MICTKCGKDNLIKANYCAQCGHAFSRQEKEAAYNQTIYGKLDRFDEVKSWVTLKKITGNFFVRLLVLACIAAIGFLTHTNRGTEMKLLESNEYAIDWNSSRNEYYLYSDLDQVHLKLYLPGKPESIGVDVLDAEGNVISSETYSTDTEPVLEKNGSSYRISGIYEEGGTSILASVYDTQYRELMK